MSNATKRRFTVRCEDHDFEESFETTSDKKVGDLQTGEPSGYPAGFVTHDSCHNAVITKIE